MYRNEETAAPRKWREGKLAPQRVRCLTNEQETYSALEQLPVQECIYLPPLVCDGPRPEREKTSTPRQACALVKYNLKLSICGLESLQAGKYWGETKVYVLY